MTPQAQITDYYDALSNMKISIHKIEVFNKLSNLVELPHEFILVFLKSCMRQCKESNESKQARLRLVRLICVFL